MKRIVALFMLMMVATISLNAQEGVQWEYHPFAKEGKVWENSTMRYELKGDTAINGKTFKRVFLTEKGKETMYWAAVRDEGMKVYMVKDGSTSETLLYDFGIVGEDEIDYGAMSAVITGTYYSKTNAGETYKVLAGHNHINGSDMQMSLSIDWVDGIGNTSGPFDPASDSGEFTCYEDGICVFNTAIHAELIANHRTNPLTSSYNYYTDPATMVVYSYDPLGTSAQVKAGERIDVDGEDTYYTPGSPDAKGQIAILNKFTVDGKEYTVTKIDKWAFSKCDITSVTIPSAVRTIDMEAFYGCTSLVGVNMNKGLKDIGYYAFYGCTSLPSVVLPSGLRMIYFEAFGGCTSLASVTIPSSVESIDRCAFWRSGLTSIISLIEDPFVVSDICDLEYSSPVLYVPGGTKEKYESTEGWNQFADIMEIDMSSYRPLLKDGKVWKEESLYGGKFESTYRIDGETTVNGKSYFNVYAKSVMYKVVGFEDGKQIYSDEGEVIEDRLRCLIREENGRVYSLSGKETLLYDFNVQVGDEIYSEVYMGDEATGDYGKLTRWVNDIDVIQTASGPLKRICLKMAGTTYVKGEMVNQVTFDQYLIEGVGHSLGLLRPVYEGMVYGRAYCVVDCQEDGMSICTIADYDPSYYSTSVPTIRMPRASASQIFDLQGRCLNGAPTKGMYIKDGKKHVVK